MRKRLVVVAAVAVLVAMAASLAYIRIDNPVGETHAAPTVTETELVEVSEAAVFFAHQSVGMNILGGIESVYASHGLGALPVSEAAESEPAHAGAGLLHVRIGDNGDPLGKIAAFESMIRSGLGDQIDVAVLKLCYEDVRAGDDIDAIFAAYQETLAALERDYPDVAFVASTVPLNVKRGPLGTLRGWVGLGNNYGPEHNALREQFNAMLRAEYGSSGLLFDVAAVESTKPSGDRITGLYDGQLYYALDKAYATDAGHLNAAGAAAVAEAFLAVVAQALAE